MLTSALGARPNRSGLKVLSLLVLVVRSPTRLDRLLCLFLSDEAKSEIYLSYVLP